MGVIMFLNHLRAFQRHDAQLLFNNSGLVAENQDCSLA